MEKNFDIWNEKKKDLDAVHDLSFYFKEGEIWWASAGINVGYEENGKGLYFRRPFLIIRKFNQHLAYAVPLTTTMKTRPYHIHLTAYDGKPRQAIVSQCKAISPKRLSNKICSVSSGELEKIRSAVKVSFDSAS